MFSSLSYPQFEDLSKTGRPVVVFKEIPGENLTPASVFRGLGAFAEGASLLESGLVGHLGNFSFLHLTPIQEVSVTGATVSLKENGTERTISAAPLKLLRKLHAENAAQCAHFLSGFTGGLIGYAGYGSAALFETLPDRHRRDDSPPDMVFRRYRNTIAFDHQSGKVVVSSLVEPSPDTKATYEKGMRGIDGIIERLASTPLPGDAGTPEIARANLEIMETMDDDAFRAIVEQAKEHIRAGDVFQVVLSRAFETPVSADPFDVYRALKVIGPSPFMFYLDLGERVIAGASPEKLVSLSDDMLESCPLAGTRPRGKGYDDKALEEELINDPKERAEHTMLVDLARNDLGAISVPGSVKVTNLMEVEHFTSVMHITSSVEGRLNKGRDAFDALRYTCPAGTLSGAPKIRAMEIIDALENSRRNVYGGAVCAIDNLGNLNSCIVIRTMEFRDGVASVRAGAGIVFDSDPQKEADETRHKARSVLDAIAIAEGGAL